MCATPHVYLPHAVVAETLCTPSEMQAAEKRHLKESREVLKTAWEATVQRNSFKIELPLWKFPILSNW